MCANDYCDDNDESIVVMVLETLMVMRVCVIMMVVMEVEDAYLLFWC